MEASSGGSRPSWALGKVHRELFEIYLRAGGAFAPSMFFLSAMGRAETLGQHDSSEVARREVVALE